MNQRIPTIVLLTVVTAVAAPAAARADRHQQRDSETPQAVVHVAAPEPLPHRDWSVDLNLGLGTPAGPVSLSRDFHATDRIGARLSLGIANLTLMPYLRQRLGEHTELRLSAGATAGLTMWREQHGWCFSDECASKRSWTTVFGNAEASIIHRVGGPFHIKPYLGVAAALNPDSLTCAGTDDALAHCQSDHAGDGTRRIYGGVSIGLSW